MMTTTRDGLEILRRRYIVHDPEFAEVADQYRQRFDIGQQVYDLREAAGLTQEQLAEKAGLIAEDVDALELGDWQDGTFEQLVKLLTALGKQAEATTVVVRQDEFEMVEEAWAQAALEAIDDHLLEDDQPPEP